MTPPIIKGIQLPAFDLEMLGQGRLICVPFKQFVASDETFWLYPAQPHPANLTLETYYKPQYHQLAHKIEAQYATFPLQMRYWATVDQHWQVTQKYKHLLPRIAQTTIWNLQALQTLFDQYQALKLLFLRVYQYSNPCIIYRPLPEASFFWPNPEDRITPNQETDLPIVSQASFQKRKAWLMTGKEYPYLALEALQLQLAEISEPPISVQILSHNLKTILGWTSPLKPKKKVPDWMNSIAALGNRSVIEDTGKSNYQAGTDFEEIVRKSLEYIGFTIDHFHRGGAGGLDLFCSAPYPLIGECKSGKKIPNDTAVQLLNLGTLRLANKHEFSQSTKLIIGPGQPTDQLQKAAKVHGMAIINPRTLERLVKLHHQYPIDLFRLRDFLVDGQADDAVEHFIQQYIQELELRSHITKQVRKFLKNTGDDSADVSQLHAIYSYPSAPKPLKREEFHEILIELSSPLAGYLGRKQELNGGDRFYFLRELIVDNL
jgi:hypothetical protein